MDETLYVQRPTTVFHGVSIFSGEFELWWEGDYYRGRNKAVSTTNNTYLAAFGLHPDQAVAQKPSPRLGSPSEQNKSPSTEEVFLWMSDYHPDGGQLFWPLDPPDAPFVVCLGKNTHGDDVRSAHYQYRFQQGDFFALRQGICQGINHKVELF